LIKYHCAGGLGQGKAIVTEKRKMKQKINTSVEAEALEGPEDPLVSTMMILAEERVLG